MNCTTHSLCVVRSVKLHRKSFGTENMYLFRQVSRLCVIPLSRVCCIASIFLQAKNANAIGLTFAMSLSIGCAFS